MHNRLVSRRIDALHQCFLVFSLCCLNISRWIEWYLLFLNTKDLTSKGMATPNLCWSINLAIISTKLTIRLVRPAKTQISLRIRAVWSESSLIACAFYSLRAIQGEINENPCDTWWDFRLIWVFVVHTGVFVGFVMRWLLCDFNEEVGGCAMWLQSAYIKFKTIIDIYILCLFCVW